MLILNWRFLIAELLSTDSNAVTNFLQEAILMKDFNHANVLSLIGVVMNEQKLPMVIIPFMSKGDLKNVLRSKNEVCWYCYCVITLVIR